MAKTLVKIKVCMHRDIRVVVYQARIETAYIMSSQVLWAPACSNPGDFSPHLGHGYAVFHYPDVLVRV